MPEESRKKGNINRKKNNERQSKHAIKVNTAINWYFEMNNKTEYFEENDP